MNHQTETPPYETGDKHRPIVIGAGMAGVAAAVELAHLGQCPVLIESRPYIGGRTRSFAHTTTGDEIDNGQHLMMGCYRSTFRLLELLGTRHLVELHPGLSIQFRTTTGERSQLSASRLLPPPLNILSGMMGIAALTRTERLKLLNVARAVRSSSANPQETVAEYLGRHGQSANARRWLWNPLVIATLNAPPEIAAASLFVEVMRLAFLGEGDASRLGFPRVGLSELLAPAFGYIERHGGTVVTAEAVSGMDRKENSWQIAGKSGRVYQSPYVITALPLHTLQRLMQHGMLGWALSTLTQPVPHSPIVSLYLWYNNNPETLPGFCALIGTNVQWMFNRRRITGTVNPDFPGLISCTISAAFQETATNPQTVIETADRELRKAFPELAEATLLDSLVIKEKHATFTPSPAFEQQRPGASTNYPGLYLAGDWTATGLPGTIEGAVQSGFRAAQTLHNDLANSLPS